ncbi:methyltransferase domain-containing protein [Rhodoferax sp. GW822-FHT02A01]|uniref:class I SAM-dependent methyltransferase n=1 Tax=Rhodoferax sp. GW822-FHT02A01 TaxID=3141537 RepID=UPI00315D38F6
MSLTTRPCPICSSTEAQPCLDNPMAAVGGFDMSYKVVRCSHCGFHYAQELPDADTFSAYYQSVSKYDAPDSVAPVDRARIDATVRFLEGRVGKSERIADLGCGYGALLGGLQAAGWQHLEGLDPAPNAAQCALKMFGVRNIHRGLMSEAHTVLDLQSVDLVCIMCVLEHLPQLRQDMAKLVSRLRPGCKILLEVPAIECFLHPDCEPFGEFSLEHIQFFDMASLANLMQSLGAKQLALELLDLPMVASGSMLGLFEWSGSIPQEPTFQRSETGALQAYIEESQRQLDRALQRVPAGPVIVYGAGSHTARLLAHLEKIPGCEVRGIVDSNPNLEGKRMGRWTVRAPSSIHETPDTAVLVSSFRSQQAIAAHLRKTAPNPLVLLYH